MRAYLHKLILWDNLNSLEDLISITNVYFQLRELSLVGKDDA